MVLAVLSWTTATREWQMVGNMYLACRHGWIVLDVVVGWGKEEVGDMLRFN